MVTTKDERTSWSLDNVLLAINPRHGLNTLKIRDVVGAISEARRDSEPNTEEIEEIVKMMIASSVNAEVNNIIGNFFVPNHRRRQRVHLKRRNAMAHGVRRLTRAF